MDYKLRKYKSIHLAFIWSQTISIYAGQGIQIIEESNRVTYFGDSIFSVIFYSV